MPSFDYDHTYSPPAPIVQVTLVAQAGDHSNQTIRALIDSGADESLLPLDTLLAAGATLTDRRLLRGITGVGRPVNVYRLSVEIAGYRIRGIRAAGLPQIAEAVLGRNVLQELRVHLDGPGETVEIWQ